MSTSIEASFVKKFEAEVHHEYQRMGTQTRPAVRQKTGLVGESTTFQRVGRGTAGKKQRHGKVPVMNIPHDPVECFVEDDYAGDWVDKLDELAIHHDERRVIAQSGAWALGRKTDEHVIGAAMNGTHGNGSPIGLSTIALETVTQQIIVPLGSRDVPDDGQRWAFVTWAVWGKLLEIPEFASQDYVSDRPFAGPATPKMWLGVVWQPFTGLTNTTAQVYRNLIWHRTAVGLAVGAEISLDITWHGDYAAHFINNMMKMGAVMIDNDGIQFLDVDEAT